MHGREGLKSLRNVEVNKCQNNANTTCLNFSVDSLRVLVLNRLLLLLDCDALRNLVQSVQFKKVKNTH